MQHNCHVKPPSSLSEKKLHKFLEKVAGQCCLEIKGEMEIHEAKINHCRLFPFLQIQL